MIAILVTGPNASGKSTLVDTATAPWATDPRVLTIHGDTGSFSKGTPEETAALVTEVWNSDVPVLVIEGIDRIARAVYAANVASRVRRELTVNVTAQSPDVMLAHLKARCEKRGKAFNESYWDQERLVYEGQNRYRNLATRYFASIEPRTWSASADYASLEPLIRHIRGGITRCLVS